MINTWRKADALSHIYRKGNHAFFGSVKARAMLNAMLFKHHV